MVKCPRCGGSGSVKIVWLRTNYCTCQVCHGEGEISQELMKLWKAKDLTVSKWSKQHWSHNLTDPEAVSRDKKLRTSMEKAEARLVQAIGTEHY